MTQSALWEALAPLVTRTPKIVREHEILRVAANIRGKDAEKSAEIARREVLKWVEKRSGGRLPKEAWTFDDFEYFSGGRNSIGLRLESGVTDIWAIRADDPDKNVPGRIWTTEIIVGILENQRPRFSARLVHSWCTYQKEITAHHKRGLPIQGRMG